MSNTIFIYNCSKHFNVFRQLNKNNVNPKLKRQKHEKFNFPIDNSMLSKHNEAIIKFKKHYEKSLVCNYYVSGQEYIDYVGFEK